MKLFLLLFVFVTSVFAEVGMPALEKADGKHVFIFFYRDKNERTVRAEKVFDGVAEKVDSSFVKVQVNDPSETIVKKFGLERSPMPFVMVFAPNGAVTGGFSNFSE